MSAEASNLADVLAHEQAESDAKNILSGSSMIKFQGFVRTKMAKKQYV